MPSNPLERLVTHDVVVDGLTARVHELSRLRLEQAERSDLPTFVLVHGLGVSSRYFVPVAELLASEGWVILLDLPGFGGTPRSPHPMRIADFADLVRAVLRRLDVTRPILVGHSMGAQVVVEMLADEPDLSHANLLIGPVVNADERRLRTVARRFVQSSVREKLRAAAVSLSAYAVAGPWWVREVFPRILDYPIEERIARVRGRLTILRGAQDFMCPPEWVDALAAAATGATVRTAEIEGAAHQVIVGDADRVVAEALELAGIGTGAH